MFAVFHNGNRFGADIQLEGRFHWNFDASVGQSGLLHMFQDGIGQQTGDYCESQISKFKFGAVLKRHRLYQVERAGCHGPMRPGMSDFIRQSF